MGIHHGGQTGKYLAHQFVQLFLGQLQGFFRLFFLQIIQGPDAGGIGGLLRQFLQKSGARLQFSFRYVQPGQL